MGRMSHSIPKSTERQASLLLQKPVVYSIVISLSIDNREQRKDTKKYFSLKGYDTILSHKKNIDT